LRRRAPTTRQASPVQAGPVQADPVQAMAVSVLGEAVVAVGSDGHALAPSPVSFDARARRQAAAFAQAFGAEVIYTLTGQPVHPMFSIQKIAWWRAEDPALFAAAWKFLCFGDFVLCKLGLEPVIDYSMAARTQAFDVQAHRWSPEVLDWAGITPERLATPAPAGTPVGTIPPDIARDLGFRAPVLVVAGGHDQPCGALGSGALAEGEAMYALGTTAVLAPTLAAPVPGLAADGFPCYPHVLPDRWITLAGMPSGGVLLRWFREQFGDREEQQAAATGRDLYELLIETAFGGPTGGAPAGEGPVDEGPGPLLLLPHFAGSEAPFHNPNARGALLGLSLNTKRGDLVRAILEGVALEIALYAEHLRAAGVRLDRLRVIGGGARSARWMQLNADLLNLPIVTPPVTEATALGAALLAGWGVGCYDSLQSALHATQQAGPARTFAPRPALAEAWAERCEIFRRLYPAVAPLHADLFASLHA